MDSISKSINEWSFKRLARFYDKTFFDDPNFKKKIDKIYDLIENEKCDDINFIAKESGCTYEECVIKIRYLKNKRVLGDYYIDTINGIIKMCSLEDQKLLNKYSGYIYNSHAQVDEIATKIPVVGNKTKQETMKDILKELNYLDSKGLLNGVKINNVDGKIIYYSIEKHKHDKDMYTIECPNCGALKDVNIGGKERCDYCHTIISGVLK